MGSVSYTHLDVYKRQGAVSVNQNCASGMRAMEIAANNIMLGNTEIGLVVGVESMTNAPYLLPKGRMGYRMGPGNIEDSMIHDGLFDALVPGHMGVTADNVAKKYGITRQECDELAVMSHTRAAVAIDEGRFKREIVPVDIKVKKEIKPYDTDEHLIRNCTMESIGKMKPVFSPDGVTTAANASGINDGAAAAVTVSYTHLFPISSSSAFSIHKNQIVQQRICQKPNYYNPLAQ